MKRPKRYVDAFYIRRPIGDGCDSVCSVPNAFSWRLAVFHLLTQVEALCWSFFHLTGKQCKNALLTQIKDRKGSCTKNLRKVRRTKDEHLRKDCPSVFNVPFSFAVTDTERVYRSVYTIVNQPTLP
jgi:hypothetical protein